MTLCSAGRRTSTSSIRSVSAGSCAGDGGGVAKNASRLLPSLPPPGDSFEDWLVRRRLGSRRDGVCECLDELLRAFGGARGSSSGGLLTAAGACPFRLITISYSSPLIAHADSWEVTSIDSYM